MSKRFPFRPRPSFDVATPWPAFAILAALPLAASPLSAVPGDIFRWLGMMLAPGAAIYLASERRQPRLSVLVLCALILSPLVTTLLGIAGLWMHVQVMTIVRVTCAAGVAAAAAALVTLRVKVASPDRRSLRWLGVLLFVLVFLTAFLPMTHAWWRVRSDAWFHGAVVAQIADFGLPPQDPYFAGLPLQYMWFYHVLVLVLSRGLDMDPFRVMALVNIQALLGLGVAAWQLCGVFRRNFAHRLAGTAMLLLGFNGAFWLLLPLKLSRVLTGEVRGWAEVKRTYSLLPFNYDHARQFMKIYYNWEFFLDKYMVATAFGLALTFTVAGWYGACEFMRTRRPAPLVLLAGALVGMLGFHSLLGFVMLVGVFGGAILAFIFRGRDAFPVRSTLVLLGVALASFLAMTPYIREVTHLKQKEQMFPLSVSVQQTAAIIIPSLFALGLWLVRRPLLGERTPAARFFVLGLLSVSAFCLVITLPGPNAYDKLGYLVFLPLSVLGGFALADLWSATTGRAHRAVVALTVVCMLPVNAIAFAACFATPDEATMTAPEARMSQWLRDYTPRNALIIDDNDRVVFLVTVPRRYYWGRTTYAQMWGYPKLEMARRLHVRRAIYAPGVLDGTTLAELAAAADPIYVIVRPEHWDANAAVITNTDLFQAVYRDEKYAILRVDTYACRAASPSRPDRLSPEELIRESGL